jgi:hypothetical protein
MDFIPFEWPAEWTDPAALDLLQGTPVNCLLLEDRSKLAALAERGEKQGLKIFTRNSPPAGVHIIKGVWPGIRMSREQNTASSGPTGAPWVDSNGWALQLARVQAPGKSLWVTAEPAKDQIVRPDTHVLAVADAASHGGAWAVYLAGDLRKGVAARDSKALDVWKRMLDAIRFFEQRKEWAAYEPHGILGVVSDFSGGNEFMSTEILNLTARQNQPYQILLKSKLTDASLKGLEAVIYPDDEPPSEQLRKRLLAFAEAGGLLIVSPKWGDVTGEPAGGDPHPRFKVVKHGKGRIALATEFDDPFVVSCDARIVMSHRHDLVRFWNAGSIVAYYTLAPGGKRAVVHMINYAARPGRDLISCRIAGPWRSARFWALEKAGPVAVETVRERNALEVHLPAIPVYGAVDLVA